MEHHTEHPLCKHLAVLTCVMCAGTELVVIRSDDMVSLELDDDLVLYAFQRVLTLLGNPSDITVAKSFLYVDNFFFFSFFFGGGGLEFEFCYFVIFGPVYY